MSERWPWMSTAEAMQDPRGATTLVPCWWQDGPRWVLRAPDGTDLAIVVRDRSGWWCGLRVDGRGLAQEQSAEAARAEVDRVLRQQDAL